MVFLSGEQTAEDGVPGLAIGALEHGGGIAVAEDFFCLRVPF
jgi:hypothetical protein